MVAGLKRERLSVAFLDQIHGRIRSGLWLKVKTSRRSKPRSRNLTSRKAEALPISRIRRAAKRARRPQRMKLGRTPVRRSARDAHHCRSAPPVICAARGCRSGSGRALVANGQTLLPPFANASALGCGVASDAAATKSKDGPRCKGETKQAGHKEGRAERHRDSSSYRIEHAE